MFIKPNSTHTQFDFIVCSFACQDRFESDQEYSLDIQSLLNNFFPFENFLSTLILIMENYRGQIPRYYE